MCSFQRGTRSCGHCNLLLLSLRKDDLYLHAGSLFRPTTTRRIYQQIVKTTLNYALKKQSSQIEMHLQVELYIDTSNYLTSAITETFLPLFTIRSGKHIVTYSKLCMIAQL